MATKDFVSVILPVKNEPYLTELIENLRFYLSKSYPNYEIIIVTGDKRIGTSIPYVPLNANVKFFKSYGDSLERAILLGFSVSKGEKIIVMDADGSHPPGLVPELIDALDSNEMVVASRFGEKGHYQTSISRYFATAVFNQYAKLLGCSLSDPMSGFFGIQTQLLTKLRFKPIKWKIALEISNRLRPKTAEVSFTFQKRKVGRSKLNWRIGVKLMWDILEMAL